MSEAVLSLPGVLLSGKPPVSIIQRKRMRVEFGETLSLTRMRHYPKRKHLARKVGVNVALINDLELGHETQGRATVQMLNKIAEAVGCELKFFDPNGQEESCHGATDTLENLIAAGITPDLVPW